MRGLFTPRISLLAGYRCPRCAGPSLCRSPAKRVIMRAGGADDPVPSVVCDLGGGDCVRVKKPKRKKQHVERNEETFEVGAEMVPADD